MTAEVAFVEAIRADPADDLNWSVYADWLEEHGDPLGDLLRVHLRLEKLAASDPDRSSLEGRRRELEMALDEWERRLAGHAIGVRCHRGFVAELHIDVPRWPLSDASQTRHRLESVRSALAASSHRLGLLRTLGIQGDHNYGSESVFHLDPDFVSELLALGCFANLHTLDIDDNGTLALADGTVQAVVTHPNLGRLGKLILNRHRVGDDGCQALAEAGRSGLTWLELRSNGIGDAGARALADSPRVAKVTDLDLRYNRIGDEGAAALAASPHLGSLRKLKLYDNPIGPEAVKALKGRFGATCLLPQMQRPERQRPGDWYCFECGASNFAARASCYECRGPRPEPWLREGDWLCLGCNAHNFARRHTCHQCKAARPSSP